MLARLQWSAFGLRGRIVGAVLVTAVATLMVATIVLLPQLEQSLKTASETTLRNDVRTAHDQIEGIGRIRYELIPLAGEPALRHTRLAGEAVDAELTLRRATTALAHDLGATDVTLVGYITRAGSGRAVSLEPGTTAVPAGFGALDDITEAYFRGRAYYSFGSVGGRQVVRVAIPLGDDAVIAVRKSIDEIPTAVRSVRRAFEIAALAGFVLTMLLAIPLAGTLVRRLETLRDAAQRVATEGTGVELPIDRARDEVGDLARSFAIMQRRLRHQEEARRAFVATASHELRTPLASLDGMLELLADDLRGPAPDMDDANALLNRARVQSRRLGRLAADLLDLSRIDADVQLRSEPIELGELARAVLAEFEIAMREHGVAGVLRGPTEPVWALGDPGSVARILRILVDNALRVAPAGTEIVIELAALPAPAVRVIDRGPGIAREERALIFERFKRGRDTGGEAGFGLGLAIGRELAERMGGALVLGDSVPPGATFVLTLRPVASGPDQSVGEKPSAAELMQ